VVRAELAAARAAFHQLLLDIPDAAWREKALGSAWTVREEMWHIAWGARLLLDLAKNARRGVGFPLAVGFVADRLNLIYTRLRAKGATPRSIAAKYDDCHNKALGMLASVQDEEWGKSVWVLGQQQTVEQLLRAIPHHSEEHADRIRPLAEARRGTTGSSGR
jgi:hypothetical protein